MSMAAGLVALIGGVALVVAAADVFVDGLLGVGLSGSPIRRGGALRDAKACSVTCATTSAPTLQIFHPVSTVTSRPGPTGRR